MFMRRTIAIIASLVLLLAAQPALACPGCKDNLTEQHVNAYGWSIIFMMSMPFLILGTLSAYFYYEVRKARKLQLQSTVRWTESASPTGVAERVHGGTRGLVPPYDFESAPVSTSPGLGSQS